MTLASITLAAAIAARSRLWFADRRSRRFTWALIYLLVASVLSPPVLGHTLEPVLYDAVGSHNLPDFASNSFVVIGAWALLTMVAKTTGLQTHWYQHVLVAACVASMLLTYIAAPRLREQSTQGLLSTTGAGPETYIAIYAAAIIWAGIRVLLLARTLKLLAKRGNQIHIRLSAAAALAILYGAMVATFISFDADDRIFNSLSYIAASWWLASVALIALAMAAMADLKPSDA